MGVELGSATLGRWSGSLNSISTAASVDFDSFSALVVAEHVGGERALADDDVAIDGHFSPGARRAIFSAAGRGITADGAF